VIITLEVILTILGFASGINFLLDPSGQTHGMDTSILVTTPVSDFTSVGIFFVVCFGIMPSVAIYGLWKLPRWRWNGAFDKWSGKNWAWTVTAVIGVILIVWIVVEVVLIGSPAGLPRFLQIAMAFLGVVLIMLTMLPSVRTYAKSPEVTLN